MSRAAYGMRTTRAAVANLGILVTLTGVGWAALQEATAQSDDWRRVERDELCVTTGSIQRAADQMAIDGPETRATLRTATSRAAELRFTYLGPTDGTAPLASGEPRRQIGLKLRAQDTCNVVYVMWHIEPDTKIAVSVKRYPAAHTHAACGARGYISIKPQTETPVPAIALGSPHTLRATLREDRVDVEADGILAFSGPIERAALDFDGPVGLRTDNARFQFDYSVAAGQAGPLSPPFNGKHNRCLD